VVLLITTPESLQPPLRLDGLAALVGRLSDRPRRRKSARAAWDQVVQAISEAQEATRRAQAVPSEVEAMHNSEPPRPHSKDRWDDRIGRVTRLAVLGSMALLIPFVGIGSSLNLSVSTAYSLCSSGLGAMIQAGGVGIASEWTAVNVRFCLGWSAVLVGGAFIVLGAARVPAPLGDDYER